MAELSFQIARQVESIPTAGTFIPLRHFTKMILRGFDWTPRLFEQKHRMDNHIGFGWILLVTGLVTALVGLIWIASPTLPWLGRLPGDIRYEGDRVRFYFPLMTCLVVSLLLSGIFWLLRRFFHQ
jgi:hypothetical protein